MALEEYQASREKIVLSPEAAQGLRSTFFSLFGGPEKLDLWLTTLADDLADSNSPRVRPLPLANVPVDFQAWMRRPHEVVDMLLERLHALTVWHYTARITNEGNSWFARVHDNVCGHLLEEIEGPGPVSLTGYIAAKYGPNLEIVEE